MSEQQSKDVGSKVVVGSGAEAGESQRELTPEELAGVVGGINQKNFGIVGPQDNPE